MIYRPDVWFAGPSGPQLLILGTLREVETKDRPITISGGDEGTHSTKSKHWIGHAIDCFCMPWNEEEKSSFAEQIRMRLPSGYDVVPEVTHVHIEYDPKIRAVTIQWR